MSPYLRAALLGALITCAVPAHAEHLFVHVPLGQQSLTAQNVAKATHEMRAIPGGADVVPAKEFEKSYVLGMKDMLQETPGVFVQPRWGEESRLSIRGSGLSRSFHMRGITLLQDGIPFNLADGSADFQELDPLAIQHLEVYRGGQALRYGTATLGGAVNAVTKTARNMDYNGLLRLEGGSFNTMRTHAEAGKVFERSDVFASISKTLSEGYRENNEQNNTRLNSNFGFKLGNNAETRFYVGYNRINQNIPGTLTRAGIENSPTSTPAINVLDQYARDIRSLRIANRTVIELGHSLNLELGGYANDKNLYHPIFQVVDQNSLDTGLFARLKGPWTSGNVRHDFTAGFNLGRGTNDAKRFTNEGGVRGVLTADAKQLARNVELYGENRTYLTDAWSIIAGAQASLAMREYIDLRNAANNAEKNFRSFNPKLGVMWEPSSQTELYASITSGTEVPTFSELVQGAIPGFVPVKLQKSLTAEIGTRGEQGAFSWDATMYRSHLTDEMLQFAVTPDIPASTFNANKTIHQGIELGLGWQATENLGFQLVYNLNDFRFDGDTQFGDNDLAGAPAHQFRVSMPYKYGAWTVEPSVEYVPQGGWIDYANTMKAEHYAVVNVKGAYDVTEDVSVFFDARNLTDEQYSPSFSTITDARTANREVFFPADGRSAYMGLQIKF